MKDQQTSIWNIIEFIEEKEKSEVLININKLLSYILSFNIESNEQYLNEIDIINIELKYPTSIFEMIYSQVLKLKQKYENQIWINIFINRITITGDRFRYDENIHSILFGNRPFGNDIKEISGANVGFIGTGGGCSRWNYYLC